MAKNLQRLRRELRRIGQDDTVDFYPVTYVYPGQYVTFLDDLRRKDGPWIAKPIAGSMGQGIVFITSEREAVQFNQRTQATIAGLSAMEEKQKFWYVLQRYIPNPLLIGGRKFDIRLYALTLSYQPLIVYVYRGGFCRFSSQPFSMNFASRETHLTNIAVQTHSTAYNPRHGCKWDTYSLRAYIANRYGMAESNRVFTAVQGIILQSLLSVAPNVISDKHCYELYGYDVLIADDLRPWLIEINASPSLDANTEDDYDLKFSFLNEMLDLVQLWHAKAPDAELPLHYGGYDLAWNGGPVVTKAQSTVTSFIGCHCQLTPSPNNPYRTDSKFRVKKAHPIPSTT
jgi:tubulin polyglutamylase TTLL9